VQYLHTKSIYHNEHHLERSTHLGGERVPQTRWKHQNHQEYLGVWEAGIENREHSFQCGSDST